MLSKGSDCKGQQGSCDLAYMFLVTGSLALLETQIMGLVDRKMIVKMVWNSKIQRPVLTTWENGVALSAWYVT